MSLGTERERVWREYERGERQEKLWYNRNKYAFTPSKHSRGGSVQPEQWMNEISWRLLYREWWMSLVKVSTSKLFLGIRWLVKGWSHVTQPAYYYSTFHSTAAWKRCIYGRYKKQTHCRWTKVQEKTKTSEPIQFIWCFKVVVTQVIWWRRRFGGENVAKEGVNTYKQLCIDAPTEPTAPSAVLVSQRPSFFSCNVQYGVPNYPD